MFHCYVRTLIQVSFSRRVDATWTIGYVDVGTV
jgi:hypothetical protein